MRGVLTGGRHAFFHADRRLLACGQGARTGELLHGCCYWPRRARSPGRSLPSYGEPFGRTYLASADVITG